MEKSVEETVHTLKTHPLMPKDIEIKGFIMDSETGELTEDVRKKKIKKKRDPHSKVVL